MLRLVCRITLAAVAMVAISPAGSSAQPVAAPAVESALYQAIDNLGYAPEEAAESVPRLQESLNSKDAQVRWRSARALGLLGDAASAAAPALVKLLADEEPVVQVHASIALARIGDMSETTLEALISKVTSSDERVARAALQTLRHLDAPPEKLAGALEGVLESADAAVMSLAVEAMVERGAAATPFLNAALAKEKAAYWAAVAISVIGPDAVGTVPALTELLGTSSDPQTLQMALVALAKIGTGAQEAASAVHALASKTDDDGVRIAACYAIGAMGSADAASLLSQLEAAGGPFQEMVCAWGLAKLRSTDGDAQDHAVALLVEGLKSDRAEMRNAAAAGLKELDAPRAKVGPALIAAVRTASAEQKSHIALALATLGPETVPRAVEALADPELRDVAIEVLGRLGADAAGGVDGLIRCLDLDKADCVARAQYALAAIGSGAGKAADRLGANLSHEAAKVRQSALFALRQIGAEGQSARGALHGFLESADDEFEGYATAWALSRMKLDAAVLGSVTKSLDAALDSSESQIRLETIAAIGDLGPAGESFRAKLQQLADSDPSAEVRAAATATLGSL